MLIRTALLDPYPVVQQGFKNFFSKTENIDVVVIATTISELMEALEYNTIHVVLCEMDVTDSSPIKMIKDINKRYPQIRVLIFTALPDSVYAISLLKAGAIGFLSKRASPSVIIEAIEKVYCDGYYIMTNFANKLHRNIDLKKPRTVFGKLSAREIEVLKYLVEGKRNIDISRILGIHQKTVNTYKNRIMNKLQVNNLVDLYQQARSYNLV